jgi:hypothetical protein
VRLTELGEIYFRLPPVAGQPLRGGAGGGAPSGGAPGLLAHHGPGLLRREPHRPAGERLHGALPPAGGDPQPHQPAAGSGARGLRSGAAARPPQGFAWWRASWRSGCPMCAPLRPTPPATACPTVSG